MAAAFGVFAASSCDVSHAARETALRFEQRLREFPDASVGRGLVATFPFSARRDVTVDRVSGSCSCQRIELRVEGRLLLTIAGGTASAHPPIVLRAGQRGTVEAGMDAIDGSRDAYVQLQTRDGQRVALQVRSTGVRDFVVELDGRRGRDFVVDAVGLNTRVERRLRISSRDGRAFSIDRWRWKPQQGRLDLALDPCGHSEPVHDMVLSLEPRSVGAHQGELVVTVAGDRGRPTDERIAIEAEVGHPVRHEPPGPLNLGLVRRNQLIERRFRLIGPPGVRIRVKDVRGCDGLAAETELDEPKDEQELIVRLIPKQKVIRATIELVADGVDLPAKVIRVLGLARE